MTINDKHVRPTAADEEARALNDRQAAILEAVVTEYIGSAEPVGSSHVANAPGVQVSSATVRSEMVALERDGYLVQPHTSAGRIPTDKGYRFFVDHLTQPGVLGPAQHAQVCAFFDQVHGEMEEMLDRATGLLSELTSYAAVVVGPSHDSATIRSVQVVGLAQGLALLVVVLSDGAVEKRTIELDADVSDEVLSQSGAMLTRTWSGGPRPPAGSYPRAGTPTSTGWWPRPGPPSGSSSGRWSPTRSSWEARRGWPSRSTPSRQSVPCWASSSSSWSW